jgi:hypothetical protein
MPCMGPSKEDSWRIADKIRMVLSNKIDLLKDEDWETNVNYRKIRKALKEDCTCEIHFWIVYALLVGRSASYIERDDFQDKLRACIWEEEAASF